MTIPASYSIEIEQRLRDPYFSLFVKILPHLELHPSALIGLEAAVEGDGGVDMWRVVARGVEHRASQ